MAKVVVMPKLGLTMTEGTVSSWLKKEGDEVKEGEPLFEVETDKLTNTIEATASGVLRKIIVAAGATVPVLDKVAVIAAADEDISGLLSGGAAPAAEAAPAAAAAAPAAAAPAGGHVVASPRAKKLAKEKGIDIALVKGTGPNGRITEDDVNNYIPAPQPRRLPPSPLSRPPRWQPRWPPTRA
jgi:pyruvate dehydrogenase E2 component (dihydrolipoamide acetyltransferase)